MLRRGCSGWGAQEGLLRRGCSRGEAKEGVLKREGLRGDAQEGVQAGKQAIRQAGIEANRKARRH